MSLLKRSDFRNFVWPLTSKNRWFRWFFGIDQTGYFVEFEISYKTHFKIQPKFQVFWGTRAKKFSYAKNHFCAYSKLNICAPYLYNWYSWKKSNLMKDSILMNSSTVHHLFFLSLTLSRFSTEPCHNHERHKPRWTPKEQSRFANWVAKNSARIRADSESPLANFHWRSEPHENSCRTSANGCR